MELKVWVEGIQRIVCGVTVNTTCQDVVFALAHATGKVGRFTLIERWRNNERLLAPHENPLKILLKWGEHSNDVQFILQRSDQKRPDDKPGVHTTSKPKEATNSETNNQNALVTDFLPLGRNKETRKSFGQTNDPKHIENVGIVKGIPQQKLALKTHSIKSIPGKPSKIDSTTIVNDAFRFTSNNEFNVADLRNSLDRKVNGTKVQHDRRGASGDSFSDSYSSNNANKVSLVNNNAPPISSNGALVPPPYRDPPPPRNSPLNKTDTNANTRRIEHKDSINMTSFYNVNEMMELNENFFQNAQYKDLLQLLKYQREKLSSQQADLSKYDAEIGYLETKEKDQIEAINKEISKTEAILRQGSEQLQSLQYIEEDNELVRQQEKTLKSEITLLRSKLANCETELLQCKNKIRLLLDDIQVEQRSLNSQRQRDKRQQFERNILGEMERIQSEIDRTVQNTETITKTSDSLKKEVGAIENAITEKKKQVEQLVKEMKEVNLQSLTVAPSDEIRHLLEGSNKPGSTRRIIGSPRQLENAVPTSRNPHGVWV